MNTSETFPTFISFFLLHTASQQETRAVPVLKVLERAAGLGAPKKTARDLKHEEATRQGFLHCRFSVLL